MTVSAVSGGAAARAHGRAAAYKGGRQGGQRPARRGLHESPCLPPASEREEVARFDALGEDWWDPDGPMAPLHRHQPAPHRLAVATARRAISRREARAGRRWRASTILDIGCGAGLLAEPLARLGAEVTGLDPAPSRSPSRATPRRGDRRGARPIAPATVEELAAEGATFDVVLAMEVVEHVADVAGFVAAAASLVAPGGLFCRSTLNRTLKSFALAIVGAEYVLRWLPHGHASLGAVRHAGGAAPSPRAPRAEGHGATGCRLRSAAPKLAAVGRPERQLPVRRQEA